MHLKSVEFQFGENKRNTYPFSLSLLQGLKKITFDNPVTIIVGDNGTGKSTLLEAIAVNAGSIVVGGEDREGEFSDIYRDYVKLSWTVKSNKGFYFRANEFNYFIKRLQDIKQESQEALEEIRKRGENLLESMPFTGALSAMKALYGEGLEFRSHGESFLDLFQARLKPNGLYILDEPEAPLSPLKQLTFISLMKEMVEQNCQFIIATHSPMVMLFPSATILSIEDGRLESVGYNELEHVTITRDFLNNPESFLRHL